MRSSSFGLGLLFGTGLLAKGKASPVLPHLLKPIVVVLLDGFLQCVESGLVLLSDSGDSKDSRCLLVDNLTESRLALHNAVGHSNFAAQRGQPENELEDGI